jgi:hypothetical protein
MIMNVKYKMINLSTINKLIIPFSYQLKKIYENFHETLDATICLCSGDIDEVTSKQL